MRKLEKFLVVLSIIGITMKIVSDNPNDGNTILMIGLTFLASLYYGLGFALFNGLTFSKIFKKESYKGISAKRIIGAIGIGIALSICIIGSLFGLLGLPGASEMLIIGTVTLVVLLVILIIVYFTNKASAKDFTTAIASRAVPVLLLSVSALFNLF